MMRKFFRWLFSKKAEVADTVLQEDAHQDAPQEAGRGRKHPRRRRRR